MFPKLMPEGVGLPGLIAIVAVTHVFVAHFAVGGGWYLILTERLGRKRGMDGVVRHAERHSRFFVLLTLVFGAVSGVGIWFTIGLVSPDSTFFLIRTFVWGWAAEWCFFLIELTAALVYYKTWRRIAPKVHMAVGWVYAIAAVVTLVIINGILTFMLTPGDWLETRSFWDGIFNPSFLPTTAMRIAIAFFIAGCFGLLTSGREEDAETRRFLIARSARWVAASLVVAYPLFLWTKSTFPPEVTHLLDRSLDGARGAVPLLGTLWRLGGAAFLVLFAVSTAIAILKPRRFPTWAGAGIILLAFFAYGTAEYAREVLRKPYAVRDVIYANGIYREDVPRFRSEGYLKHAEGEAWLATASEGDKGEAMYRHQCAVCHTIDGYRGIRGLLAGKEPGRAGFATLRVDLGKREDQPMIWEAMPPVVGTEAEIEALWDWIAELTLPSK